jgi:predicted HTH domain antitoxin
MTQIILEMDAEVMAALRKEPSEMAEEVKTAAVVQWYAEGRISQSKAAQILKIPRTRFLDELFRRKVPAVQVDASELREEREWLKG